LWQYKGFVIIKYMENNDLMEKIVSLCKRRGFVFPGSEIYGGLANSWDYGPLGVELKNNIMQLWWKRFVQNRADMVGIDAALMLNPKVWEVSGHLKEFNDPLVECKNCHERFRADQIKLDAPCPNCKKAGTFTEVRQFNMMFRTNFGPIESAESTVYFRPEIAQSMFVNFKNVLDSTRIRLPFGIASQGKAFRNEITPGNFIFRTREFNLMEFEYFIKEGEWEQWFEYWKQEMHAWLSDLGINPAHVHEVEIGDGDRAHYSKRTIDFEYDYPFGRKELYGLAYRTDFDLSRHMEASGQDLRYTDPESGQKFVPHVIEPTFGLDRSILITLLEAYREEEDRVYLSLPPKLAPYKVAVFPLLKNKPELVAKAKEIYHELQKHFSVAWDDRGNVGKRYYSQDEIGTPFCITVDFDTIEKDGMVTVRNRDTKEQPRVKIEELASYISKQVL
jgi:glycyl-tRNA synthetase